MEKQVLTLVGGISLSSLNQNLFQAILKLQPKGFAFESVDLSQLPFFNQDLEKMPPPTVLTLKAKIKSADGILFITPEYNRSIPGVLKNAIDWASRPPGESVWSNKKAAILGATPGAIGTFGAQNHLRQILRAVNVHTMDQPDFYFGKANESLNENHQITNDKTKELLLQFFLKFDDWLNKITL